MKVYELAYHCWDEPVPTHVIGIFSSPHLAKLAADKYFSIELGWTDDLHEGHFSSTAYSPSGDTIKSDNGRVDYIEVFEHILDDPKRETVHEVADVHPIPR